MSITDNRHQGTTPQTNLTVTNLSCSFTHSLNFSNHFIMARVTMDPELIPGPPGTRQEYTKIGTPVS